MTSQLSYFHLGHITVKDAEPHINELYGVLERLRAQVTSQDTQQRMKAKSLLEQVGLSTTNCIFPSSSLIPLPCSLLSRYFSLGHETWYCFTLRTFTSHYALPKPTSYAISLRTMQASHLKRRRWNLSRKSQYRLAQRMAICGMQRPGHLAPPGFGCSSPSERAC